MLWMRRTLEASFTVTLNRRTFSSRSAAPPRYWTSAWPKRPPRTTLASIPILRQLSRMNLNSSRAREQRLALWRICRRSKFAADHSTPGPIFSPLAWCFMKWRPANCRSVGRALEKDRNLRYQHASDIRADLQRLKRDSDPRLAASPSEAPTKRMPRIWAGVAALIGIAVIAAIVIPLIQAPAAPKILRYVRITNDGVAKCVNDCSPPTQVSDGSRVYFVETPPVGWVVAQTSVGGGEVVRLPASFGDVKYVNLYDISPDRSQL